MDRYPEPDEVLSALSDKVVEALAGGVSGARDDLRAYREVFPSFVADHSARGLANWLHDRIWSRVRSALDDVADVSFVDREPTREMYVRAEFRLRLKRHSLTGSIRSYPTPTALDFVSQGSDLFSLLGITTLNLTAGYEWDSDSQSIGDAVLSLRDGSFQDAVWTVSLPDVGGAAGGTVAPILPPDGGPTAPTIVVANHEGDAETKTSGK